MIAVARKNLLYDKAKFLVSVSGVALSTVLVLSMLGIYFGITQQSRDIPLSSGADYWITERGARNLFNSSSFLPGDRASQLSQIAGVKEAVPIINRTTTIKANNREITAAVVGYDTKTGIGKAGRQYRGASRVGRHEAIIDRAMAQKYGLRLGGKLHIGSADFKVVGMSDNTNAMEFQYVFISFRDAVEALQQPGVNYYLVNLSAPPDEVKTALNKVLPTGELKTSETIADGNARVVSDTFLPIVGLLVFISLLVGTAVIGLTIYTATAERAKEYSVLKAVGVRERQLFGIVLQQTLISSAIGFVVGLGLYALVEWGAFYGVPTATFAMPKAYFAVFFALSLLAGIVAALIPLHKLSRIDPVEAFDS